jgi:hypothetical protein
MRMESGFRWERVSQGRLMAPLVVVVLWGLMMMILVRMWKLMSRGMKVTAQKRNRSPGRMTYGQR